MALPKNISYYNIPFCHESSNLEFFTYLNLKDLSEKCQMLQGTEVTRCRTVGILQSSYGKFYLTELDLDARKSSPSIQLSLVYLKSAVPSITMPTPVQVFGFLQWKNRPIIYVNLLQVLNVQMALRIREVMNSIVSVHVARQIEEDNSSEFIDLSWN